MSVRSSRMNLGPLLHDKQLNRCQNPMRASSIDDAIFFGRSCYTYPEVSAIQMVIQDPADPKKLNNAYFYGPGTSSGQGSANTYKQIAMAAARCASVNTKVMSVPSAAMTVHPDKETVVLPVSK